VNLSLIRSACASPTLGPITCPVHAGTASARDPGHHGHGPVDDLAPGDADHAKAERRELCVPAAITLERRTRGVEPEAVHLDEASHNPAALRWLTTARAPQASAAPSSRAPSVVREWPTRYTPRYSEWSRADLRRLSIAPLVKPISRSWARVTTPRCLAASSAIADSSRRVTPPRCSGRERRKVPIDGPLERDCDVDGLYGH
jgi:hypothetical protein